MVTETSNSQQDRESRTMDEKANFNGGRLTKASRSNFTPMSLVVGKDLAGHFILNSGRPLLCFISRFPMCTRKRFEMFVHTYE